MSKQYNIRWTQNDVKELQRLAKNFNAKVSRLEKKYGGNPDVFLPDRVTVAQMRENIGTRRDLQRELKSLQSFTQRGSDELVKIQSVNSITDNNILLTKWQKQEMQSRVKSINDKRRYHRKKLESVEVTHNGKSLGYTRGDIGMGSVEANQLRPTKPFNRRMTKGDMRAKFEHFQRESKSDYWIRRDELMRESYIKALRSNFNEEDIKGIIEQIEKMPIRTSPPMPLL